MENRKRKYGVGKFNSGTQQKPRYTPYPGNTGTGSGKFGGHVQHNHPVHNHGGHNHGGNGNHRNNSNFKNGGTGTQQNSAPAQKDLTHITCFKCQKTGHYATECPQNKQGNGNGNGNSAAKKPNPFPRAQVNHIDVEEVYDHPDTVVGKFLLNSRPVLVLFLSGATHSFISRVVVEKYSLPTRTLSQPIKVSSPGGMMTAGIGCHALSLNIGNHNFPTDLIVLES